ncbi:Protein tilB [Quaeritorhiza haematococci]|nr:Protein tilB [Quaeritorhiza haematococci]
MVQRIDKELLLRRAEHNDGELSTLREITLHQFDIEKIENLDVYCRHLEILYLQNNQIGKIENLRKLKNLRYLNLALNNIKILENLGGCESLEKLDLTVNFIEDPLDVESLKDNVEFLVGNPCSQKEGYRQFVITALPQLKVLDGKEIEKSERICAVQHFQEIRQRFLEEKEARSRTQSSRSTRLDQLSGTSPVDETATGKEQAGPHGGTKDTTNNDGDRFSLPSNTEEENQEAAQGDKTSEIERKRAEFLTKPVPHTPEARLEASRDLAAMRGTKPDQSAEQPKPKPVLVKDGRVMQRNEGKWNFRINETKGTIVLQVDISKLIDTSLIDVDVNPTWIRIVVKGKILQLVLEEEVQVSSAVCERSRHTGELVVTMLKVRAAEKGVDVLEVIKEQKRGATQSQKKEFDEKQRKMKELPDAARKNRRYERLGLLEPTEAVDLSAIVSTAATLPVPKSKPGGKNTIVETKQAAPHIIDEDFVDDPSVPPLC